MFILEISLLDYHSINVKPSILASSALYLALKIMTDKSETILSNLKTLSGHQTIDIKHLASILKKLTRSYYHN